MECVRHVKSCHLCGDLSKMCSTEQFICMIPVSCLVNQMLLLTCKSQKQGRCNYGREPLESEDKLQVFTWGRLPSSTTVLNSWSINSAMKSSTSHCCRSADNTHIQSVCYIDVTFLLQSTELKHGSGPDSKCRRYLSGDVTFHSDCPCFPCTFYLFTYGEVLLIITNSNTLSWIHTIVIEILLNNIHHPFSFLLPVQASEPVVHRNLMTQSLVHYQARLGNRFCSGSASKNYVIWLNSPFD